MMILNWSATGDRVSLRATTPTRPRTFRIGRFWSGAHLGGFIIGVGEMNLVRVKV